MLDDKNHKNKSEYWNKEYQYKLEREDISDKVHLRQELKELRHQYLGLE
jgi:hypothetical protein